jgi:hypothetical protein
MARNPDKAAAKMHQGAISRRLQTDLEGYSFDLEDTIINLLIAGYRSGTLTHDMMMGSIGEIAGLRRLAENLESDVRQGISAATTEMSNG